MGGAPSSGVGAIGGWGVPGLGCTMFWSSMWRRGDTKHVLEQDQGGRDGDTAGRLEDGCGLRGCAVQGPGVADVAMHAVCAVLV